MIGLLMKKIQTYEKYLSGSWYCCCLLILVIAWYSVKNRKSVQFEADQAKTVIDSIPVSIVHLKPDSAGYTLETAGKVKSADEVYVVSQTRVK